ncbi:MAG: hypothetical protein RLZZ121_1006, partial [Bacteroidota bacterium]
NTGNGNNTDNGPNTGNGPNTDNGPSTGNGNNSDNGSYSAELSYSWTILGNSGQTMAKGRGLNVRAETSTWSPGMYHLLWQEPQGQGRCKLLKLP